MGRKAAWWSPILLGVWDAQRDKFVALCKCMSGVSRSDVLCIAGTPPPGSSGPWLGFTDAFYKALNDRYAVGGETCATTALWNVDTGGTPSVGHSPFRPTDACCRFVGYHPSVYFKPSEVWEIRGAEWVRLSWMSRMCDLLARCTNSLTLSPTSVAAQAYVPQDRSKGISLRFPRFIRVREDKGIHDASDPSFIAKLWQLQEQKGAQGQKGADDGELLDYVEEEGVEEDDDSY